MIDIYPLLKDLITPPGLSGFESPVRQVIKNIWLPLCDEIETSRLGSLHALKRGTAPQPRPSLFLSAHMDEIGLMVTGIVDEFLRFTTIGGIDGRILIGQTVTVHAKTDIAGVIVPPPRQLLPPDLQPGSLPIQYMLIDTGFDRRQVKRLVNVGDRISFAQPPIEIADDILIGHPLDNRASLAAITLCFQTLKNRQLEWDVWAAATVQEEETLGGAITSGYQLRPSLAVVLDVTFGSSPGVASHKSFPLGKGITLGWGPTVHPTLFNEFKQLGERLEIPCTIEVMPRHSSTDADGLQVTREGIPTINIGIPLRYMHTPVEMVSLKDIERAGRLMAEFATQLEIDFMQKIKWDD
ncbi:MAG: hypothetical protein JW908_14570 [Anaerolineales bacterium]|nr:hypothetical protein [Anaerolineales bacterium]